MTAIILAGGKAKRIKKSKAFLMVGQTTIIEGQTEILKRIFDHLLIVANHSSTYQGLGARIVSDIIPQKDSLGGIYTGLIASEDVYNFILACDMPFIQLDFITYMIDQIEDYDVVIPQWEGKFEPLHAIYSKKCIKPIEQLVRENNLKIVDLLPQVKTRVIDEREIKRFDSQKLSFININTEEDYRRICSLGLR